MVLVGYRGTGKSAVAPLVAAGLGWPWIDADAELERRAGKSIAAIFAQEGEPAFRDLEAQVLRELAARKELVIAAGGGVVLRDDNRQELAKCTVVWLQASVETILARIAADKATSARRPNLLNGGEDEVRTLLAERGPWYVACANAIVNTEGQTPELVARAVIDALVNLAAKERA